MTTTTRQTMKIDVTFEIYGTRQWLGRTDREGNMVEQITYRAVAYIFGHQVAESGSNHTSEKAAIAECKRNLTSN